MFIVLDFQNLDLFPNLQQKFVRGIPKKQVRNSKLHKVTALLIISNNNLLHPIVTALVQC